MSYINEDHKYKLFINKILNEKELTNEINNIFNILLKDYFKNILNIPKIDFLSNILNDVKTILISQYTNKILENETLKIYYFQYRIIMKKNMISISKF